MMNKPPSSDHPDFATEELRSPLPLQRKCWELSAVRKQKIKEKITLTEQIQLTEQYIAISGQVTEALETLSGQLFEQELQLIQEKLTIALQEVLEQPLKLIANAEWKHNSASVEFQIEREGNTEDIMRGQGGSVANVLSVGLRMFALMTLDEKEHRRVLVLDEQDCWLRPDLVPRLVKIIHEAGQALGFQIIMISHHDSSMFERYADCIYQFSPSKEGVQVQKIDTDWQDHNTTHYER
ncbi:DNA repair protein [Gimesia sp.]|uniref:DNA repair protein n=1 Tax=Gimesia sp. TaxID=2024833 RepID=UPI000C4A5A25|nr:DNA repair protein [Gimesia sp.]MAX38205.1 DNA repair protein [Gimesia sp.]HAH44378.1 DNA repair protein [Planctomycetaceae bacterium]HBL47867.1 DNA repair protein [Planctomycetaceae bacterium]|tara:strand:- start:29368 stop:30081 length:714 start_codon:yes stop_codon:yes gene_type:complete